MQENGETEKPKQHTEEAVGSRWRKPGQQLGMSFLRKARLVTAKLCQALTIPFAVRWCVIMMQKVGHHLKSGRGVVRRGQGQLVGKCRNVGRSQCNVGERHPLGQK